MAIEIKRDKSLDILKGFAIFCVIIGHCLQYLSNTGLHSWLARGIYFFHMPLFMFISGFFYYKSTTRHSIKEVVVSKVKSLLLPSLVNSLILSVLTLTLFTVSFGQWYLNSFWFLKTLFVFTIVSLLISRNIILGSLVGLVCVTILKGIIVNYNLYQFFLVGILFSKYDLFVRGKELIFTAVLMVVFFALFVLDTLSIRFPLWEGGVESLMRLMVVLIILLGVRLISQKKSRILSLLCDWGKYTKEVYIIQVYIIECIFSMIYPWKAYTSPLIAMLIAMVVMPILVFLTKSMDRFKYINIFIFGKFKNSSYKHIES